MFATVNGGGDHQRLRKVLPGRESQECVDVTQVNEFQGILAVLFVIFSFFSGDLEGITRVCEGKILFVMVSSELIEFCNKTFFEVLQINSYQKRTGLHISMQQLPFFFFDEEVLHMLPLKKHLPLKQCLLCNSFRSSALSAFLLYLVDKILMYLHSSGFGRVTFQPAVMIIIRILVYIVGLVFIMLAVTVILC